jgi:hypothetical protein
MNSASETGKHVQTCSIGNTIERILRSNLENSNLTSVEPSYIIALTTRIVDQNDPSTAATIGDNATVVRCTWFSSLACRSSSRVTAPACVNAPLTREDTRRCRSQCRDYTRYKHPFPEPLTQSLNATLALCACATSRYKRCAFRPGSMLDAR